MCVDLKSIHDPEGKLSALMAKDLRNAVQNTRGIPHDECAAEYRNPGVTRDNIIESAKASSTPDPLDADWIELRATAKVVITADLPDKAIDALLATYNLVAIARSHWAKDGSKTSLPLILAPDDDE